MQELPARPDIYIPQGVENPPKRKRNKWAIVGAIVGGLILLGAIDAVMNPETTSTSPPVSTPIEAPLSQQDALAQASPLLSEAADNLDQITQTSALSADIQHMNRAADLTDQAAALFVGVDSQMYGYLTSAADHVRNAASTWIEDAFATDGGAAGDELDAATADLEAANALIP